MRVLVVNDAVTNAALQGQSVDSLRGAFVAQRELWVPQATNLHDFDALIIDLGRLEVGDHATGQPLGQQITELVSGGGSVICFPPVGAMSLGWLPGGFATRQTMVGERVRLVDLPPFKDFLEPFVSEMRYDCDFVQVNTWQPIATTMAGFPIAGVAEGNRMMILPRVRSPDRLVAQLFKTIIPQIVPERAVGREAPVEEPPPWLPEIEVPGAGELEAEIVCIDQKLAELQQEREGGASRPGVSWRGWPAVHRDRGQ